MAVKISTTRDRTYQRPDDEANFDWQLWEESKSTGEPGSGIEIFGSTGSLHLCCGFLGGRHDVESRSGDLQPTMVSFKSFPVAKSIAYLVRMNPNSEMSSVRYWPRLLKILCISKLRTCEGECGARSNAATRL